MYSIYTNSPSSLYIYLPPMYTYTIILSMIIRYANIAVFMVQVHSQLKLTAVTHTLTSSLSEHMSITPSVSHKTCPYPFCLSQHMSIPLQSLTKHVHIASVSHNTCQYPFSLSQNMWAIPRKRSAEYKKLNFLNKYVTGITGKLVICRFLCKKNYMIIYIRIKIVVI